MRKKPFYKSDIYGNVENINYFLPFIGNIKNKIKTEFTPDIVIAHMPSGVIFANKLKLPFVAGVHVSDLEVLTNPIYSIYFKTELEINKNNRNDFFKLIEGRYRTHTAAKIKNRIEYVKNLYLS